MVASISHIDTKFFLSSLFTSTLVKQFIICSVASVIVCLRSSTFAAGATSYTRLFIWNRYYSANPTFGKVLVPPLPHREMAIRGTAIILVQRIVPWAIFSYFDISKHKKKVSKISYQIPILSLWTRLNIPLGWIFYFKIVHTSPLSRPDSRNLTRHLFSHSSSQYSQDKSWKFNSQRI